MKKVVITGATGFIGRQTIPFLKRGGFDVHAITSREHLKNLRDDIIWHSIDLHDYDKVKYFCQTIQAHSLMHLAWYNGSRERMTSPQNMAWVEASLHLIRKFAENGGKRIVLAGSCAEYDWQYGYCSEQTTPLNPDSFYGECKASLNRIVQKYCHQKGISYCNGRIFFVYGPYEFEERLVAYVIRSLLEDRQASVTHGNQIRDYLHVTDVANALVKLLTTNVEGAVNIASGQPVALRTIVDIIGQKLNKEKMISYGLRKEDRGDHPVVFADTTQLRDELQWTPTYDLEQGITATIDWWKNRHTLTLSNVN